MNEEIDRERDETTPPSGSTGDGGAVEAAGTPGDIMASADEEIVEEDRYGPGGSAADALDAVDESEVDEADADSLYAAGSDASEGASGEWGDIPGYEDVESDPRI